MKYFTLFEKDDEALYLTNMEDSIEEFILFTEDGDKASACGIQVTESDLKGIIKRINEFLEREKVDVETESQDKE